MGGILDGMEEWENISLDMDMIKNRLGGTELVK